MTIRRPPQRIPALPRDPLLRQHLLEVWQGDRHTELLFDKTQSCTHTRIKCRLVTFTKTYSRVPHPLVRSLTTRNLRSLMYTTIVQHTANNLVYHPGAAAPAAAHAKPLRDDDFLCFNLCGAFLPGGTGQHPSRPLHSGQLWTTALSGMKSSRLTATRLGSSPGTQGSSTVAAASRPANWKRSFQLYFLAKCAGALGPGTGQINGCHGSGTWPSQFLGQRKDNSVRDVRCISQRVT